MPTNRPLEGVVDEPTYEKFESPQTNEYIKKTLIDVGLPANIAYTATWIKWQIVISFENSFIITLEKGTHYTSQTKKDAPDIIFTDVWRENIRLKVDELKKLIRDPRYKRIQDSTRTMFAEMNTEITAA